MGGPETFIQANLQNQGREEIKEFCSHQLFMSKGAV